MTRAEKRQLKNPKAKIVLGDDLVVSIASEFIENNGEDAERQKKMSAEEIK